MAQDKGNGNGHANGSQSGQQRASARKKERKAATNDALAREAVALGLSVDQLRELKLAEVAKLSQGPRKIIRVAASADPLTQYAAQGSFEKLNF